MMVAAQCSTIGCKAASTRKIERLYPGVGFMTFRACDKHKDAQPCVAVKR